MHFQFSIEAEASALPARAGRLATLRGDVLTPVFMPVATFAALRNQDTSSVDEAGFPVLLANTYHLLLRPGAEVFKKVGGIHRFMNWKRCVLTDSGGFQVFSLSPSVRMTDEGALFKSYVDGKEILLTPELSIETQKAIGSDIMMALDECVPSKADATLAAAAVERTARWAERSLRARGDSAQALFGIVQGACSPKLRGISAAQITALPFDGFAIGGLAVGETSDEREEMTALTASLLPFARPRYLMGVGTPLDILEAVARGVDMFDCIIPTALGEQGICYSSTGKIDIRRGVYKMEDSVLDEQCQCSACRNYSRAYLHHLIKTNQYYGKSLLGYHNLIFFKNLMSSIRAHIVSGGFESFYRRMQDELGAVDMENPRTAPKRKYRPARELGNFEIVKHKDGFHSVRDKQCGEVMHSVTEPLKEARELYVGQAALDVALSASDADEFVIWDVGLGAGTNAMATLLECEASMRPRKVKLVSFEQDLDALRLAIKHSRLFPHMQHKAPKALLMKKVWLSEKAPFEWVLFEGDFFELFEQADAPDCIYYDMYSLNSNPRAWTYSTFLRLRAHCIKGPAKLLTYSVSTQVRAALLAAGFFVGEGVGTGPKAATTIAYTALNGNSCRLLGKSWLDRFERSDSRVSEHCSEAEKADIEARVRSHKQFAS